MKKVSQFKDKNNHIENILIEDNWYSICQEKVGRLWRTELDGKLITDGWHDVMLKSKGKKIALDKIREMSKKVKL